MGPVGQWPLCQMAGPPMLFEDPPPPKKKKVATHSKTLVIQRQKSRAPCCSSLIAGINADVLLKPLHNL